MRANYLSTEEVIEPMERYRRDRVLVFGSTVLTADNVLRALSVDSQGRLVIAPTALGSVDIIDRWNRQLGQMDIARYLGSAIGLSNPLHDQIVYGGAVIDPRIIRTLTSADVVTVNNLLNPHPVSLASIPNPPNLDVLLSSRFKPGDSIGNTAFIANAGTNLNTSALALEAGGNLASILAKLDVALSTRLKIADFALTQELGKVGIILTTGGAIIDPRSTRALTASDIVTPYGSQGLPFGQYVITPSFAPLATVPYGNQTQLLQQCPVTYELLVQLATAGTQYDARQVRALTSSDVVTAQQTTRASMTVKPEREDLTTYGATVAIATGGTPVQVLAASGTTKIKVYDVGYAHSILSSFVYFYFGTSTTPTTRIFGSGQSSGITNATFTYAKTFVQPRVSNASDALYLYASVAGTYYVDLGYVQE